MKNEIIKSLSLTNKITQDSLIDFFSENMKNTLSQHLMALILYGSRARGDAKEFSDYDFLVVVDKKDEKVEDAILDVEVNTLNKFDKLTTCLIWEEQDWDFNKRFPIGKNIIREGILL